MEKIIELEAIDPVVFYGLKNVNLEIIKSLFSKLHIVARGYVVKVSGEPELVAVLEEKIHKLAEHSITYNSLSEDAIREITAGVESHEKKVENTIIYGINGKPITARTKNQQKLMKKYATHDLLFAVGPAGSGKTYTAIALAVRALKNREVRKIILSRPAVEAGENLGFLPGDLKEKIDPYLQPLYDALKDMIPAAKLAEMMDTETIQIAPLAYMRGRTLNDAIVILDEAQNSTLNQLKMFLTRMGNNAKFIVTGDVTQIDLPQKRNSGLVQAMRILKNIDGIAMVEFDKSDIVRHPLVRKIVEAYERDSDEQEKNQKPIIT